MTRALRFTAIGLLLALLAAMVGAQTTPADAPDPVDQPGQSVRFTSVDLFVDPQEQPLAAYQVEFVADANRVTVVGIEGGEHPAFEQPPYYDPAALSGNRVILAALNTGTDLPSARTRVATLHLRVIGDDEPVYSAKLVVAGNPQGETISVEVTMGQGAK